MEDSFRVRVDKVFGSLSPSEPLTSSLWSLTDEEIEKRSWNRESDSPAEDDEEDTDGGIFPTEVDRLFLVAKGKSGLVDENQNPSSNPNHNPGDYRKELEEDLQELDEDAGARTSGEVACTSSRSREAEEDQEEEEELDVRNFVGMDCTLDLEEEEDAYDKVAVGREETSDDRLFMQDVTDYTPHLDSYNEIPNSFKEVPRDPRANHLAAMLRLTEDQEAVKDFKSLYVSEQTMGVMCDAQNDQHDAGTMRNYDSLHATKPALDAVSDDQNNTCDDGTNLKSILKRKEGQMDTKSEKRVRFEPNCKNSEDKESEITLHRESSSQHQDPSLVPDYIRNPSRYTHYTFESLTDMNENDNRQAYADYLNLIKKSKQSEPDEVPADLSKPVIFNPKKRANGNYTSSETKEAAMPKKSLPHSFTEIEAFEMEVDCERETSPEVVGYGRRGARQYRSKLFEG